MRVISTQVIVIWCALGLMTVVTAVLTAVTVVTSVTEAP